MKRPKIICHILQSVDGNIDGDFFGREELLPALREFSSIREKYACDAVVSGAVTAKEIYTKGYKAPLPRTAERFPRTDHIAVKATKYAVIIDGQGTLYWPTGEVYRRDEPLHVISVLQENVCDTYIAHLRAAGVSYLFAGKEELDLRLAVRKLGESFGIQRMLLSGGGIVDWAFLQAGLVDEVSLVIPPIVDGGTGRASSFDNSAFAVGHAPVALRLIDVTRLAGDSLWLRYGAAP